MIEEDRPALTTREDSDAAADADTDAVVEASAGVDWAERRRRIRGAVVLSIVVGAVIAVMVVAGSELVEVVRSLSPERDQAPRTSAATTTTKPPALAAGFTCEDLAGHPLPYPHVVAYWLRTGSPKALDRDRDGRPCDDVYDEGAIEQFASVAESLPSKASCTNLVESGISYPDVIAYWLRRDRTSRLVAEDAEFPCTDVYPPQDVDGYIHFDG